MKAQALALTLLFAAGACAAGAPQQQKKTAPSKASLQRQQAEKLPGEYTCTFDISGELLGDTTCAITRASGAFHLEASGGQQALSGTLTPTDYGFQFEGDYRCTSTENCQEQVRTDFFEKKDGIYSGVIELLETEKLLTVTLLRQ